MKLGVRNAKKEAFSKEKQLMAAVNLEKTATLSSVLITSEQKQRTDQLRKHLYSNSSMSTTSSHRHFKLFKPFGYLSQFSNKQTQRKNKKLLGELYNFPKESMAIGRLDEASEGLLLITTDGKMSELVRSAKFEKDYYAQVDGLITDEPALARQVIAFREGLEPAERLLLWLASELDLGEDDNLFRDMGV